MRLFRGAIRAARWGFALSFGLTLAVSLAETAGAQEETGAPSNFVVKGFRTAPFGASEPEVRAAIARDFPKVTAADIHSAINPVTLVPVIEVRVQNLVADSGTAVVDYEFGYTSKRLAVIRAIWSRETDPRLTPERFLATGRLLAAYLSAQGYQPEGMVLNQIVKGGVALVLFRGFDAQGHVTALYCDLLSRKTSDNHVTVVPTDLMLQYTADPKHPDIYHLPAGQF